MIKSFVLLALLIVPVVASAVTKDEMEQARTIAAKSYLRYANDGSGYLDDLNPKTMEELEASLKTKEKENIKAFKAIAVPADYASWNKEQLLEYWAVKAFQDKGLLEKGRGGRIRARSQINKMTIAPPQTQAPAPASPAASTPAANAPAGEGNLKAENPVETLDELKKEEQQALEAQEIEDSDVNVDKAHNYTWVYIMILAILVGVVIALVVYAANVMKKNGMGGAPDRKLNEEHAEKLEEMEASLSDKDAEIARLNKKLETAARQNSDLKTKLDMALAELSALKNGATTSTKESSRTSYQPDVPSEGKAPLKSIYLGRANAKGIFVRADRSLNVGHSVYVLETSDGYSGSFKVADSPAAWSLALSNPKEYLENACSGRDLDNTSTASRIITEASGTAVFEGGCWRVIRKARIRYE